jgi:hypothetical protein
MELVAGKTYVLTATNGALGQITVKGNLEGWVAYLNKWKDYGKTSESGF